MKKRILITGAAGGLGMAVSEAFLAAGYGVLAAVEPGKPDQPERLRALGGELQAAAVDALDEQAVQAFVADGCREAPLQAAALLIGGFAMGKIAETGEAELDKMIALNFKSAFFFSKHCVQNMAEGGRIFLISARPALQPEDAADMLAYAISKGMVAQLADIINAQAQARNVQAALVLPSTIDTPANREAMPDADFGQWVRPEEIAQAMIYACSEAGRKQRAPVFKMYGGA